MLAPLGAQAVPLRRELPHHRVLRRSQRLGAPFGGQDGQRVPAVTSRPSCACSRVKIPRPGATISISPASGASQPPIHALRVYSPKPKSPSTPATTSSATLV